MNVLRFLSNVPSSRFVGYSMYVTTCRHATHSWFSLELVPTALLPVIFSGYTVVARQQDTRTEICTYIHINVAGPTAYIQTLLDEDIYDM